MHVLGQRVSFENEPARHSCRQFQLRIARRFQWGFASDICPRQRCEERKSGSHALKTLKTKRSAQRAQRFSYPLGVFGCSAKTSEVETQLVPRHDDHRRPVRRSEISCSLPLSSHINHINHICAAAREKDGRLDGLYWRNFNWSTPI